LQYTNPFYKRTGNAHNLNYFTENIFQNIKQRSFNSEERKKPNGVYKKYKTGELKLVEEKNVKKKEKTYYKEYLQLTQKRQYLCKFIIKQS